MKFFRVHRQCVPKRYKMLIAGVPVLYVVKNMQSVKFRYVKTTLDRESLICVDL